MIEFGFLTFWAEINAWPCPPDEFEIVIPAQVVISNSEYGLRTLLEGISKRFVAEYDYVSFECKRRCTNVLRFKRYPAQKTPTSTQDIILMKMNRK